MFVNFARLVKPRLLLGASMLTSFGMMMTSAPAPTAAAGPTAVVVAGQANLTTYPQVCSNALPGDITNPQGDPACAGNGSNFATLASVPAGVATTIDFYYEPCAPVAGGASGTIAVPGLPTRNYNWIRVGLSAVLVIKDGTGATTGAAAALFAPIPSATVHSCLTNTGPLSALVVGVGASN
jgi:hypothetical protein